MKDVELIKNIINGDKKAFDIIFERYKEYTYKISYHILKNKDDAMDNVNNAWLKIYTALINKQFKFNSKFSTWVYKIIVNEALLQLQKRKLEISIEELDYIQIPSTFFTTTEIERNIDRKIRIEKIIKLLTPLQKEIVELLIAGYNFKEIAEKLRIKSNYLYQLVSRIKNVLKKV